MTPSEKPDNNYLLLYNFPDIAQSVAPAANRLNPGIGTNTPAYCSIS